MALFSMAHLPEARPAPVRSTSTHRPWHVVALLAGALLFAAGCADEPTLPLDALEDHEAAEALAFEALLTCAVDVSAGGMDCNPASPGTAGAGDGPRLNLIVGSQHQFVRLANDSPSVNGDVLSVDVTVQNLSLQPFATADGIAPHANGVRVFFVDGPSNGVQVSNHDGAHAFLGSEPAKYHGYSGAGLSSESDLAAEGILPPGAVSKPKTWEFTLNGAEDFVFSVLISTTVPDPNPGAYGVHFTRVVGGGFHSCGLTADGRIYCWGWNVYGQIGDGTTVDRPTPVEVDAPPDVTFTDLAVGWNHTCAETDDHTAYCWGYNPDGRLGDGTNDGQWTPVEVVAPAGVTLSGLQPTWFHTCAEGDDDHFYCWGAGSWGQLGNNSLDHQSTPVKVHEPDNVSLSGHVAGYYHNCAEGDDGNAYCWGMNLFGQLGIGDTIPFRSSVPVAVEAPAGVKLSGFAAGWYHTCAEGDDGNVYCWGGNADNQLGNDAAPEISPLPVQVTMPSGVTLSELVAGHSHTCATGDDGNFYCWGSNAHGQLGNGSFVNSSTPVKVQAPQGVTLSDISMGAQLTCAKDSNGRAYCWGHNENGGIGDGTTENRPTPTPVAGTRRP